MEAVKLATDDLSHQWAQINEYAVNLQAILAFGTLPGNFLPCVVYFKKGCEVPVNLREGTGLFGRDGSLMKLSDYEEECLEKQWRSFLKL